MCHCASSKGTSRGDATGTVPPNLEMDTAPHPQDEVRAVLARAVFVHLIAHGTIHNQCQSGRLFSKCPTGIECECYRKCEKEPRRESSRVCEYRRCLLAFAALLFLALLRRSLLLHKTNNRICVNSMYAYILRLHCEERRHAKRYDTITKKVQRNEKREIEREKSDSSHRRTFPMHMFVFVSN